MYPSDGIQAAPTMPSVDIQGNLSCASLAEISVSLETEALRLRERAADFRHARGAGWPRAASPICASRSTARSPLRAGRTPRPNSASAASGSFSSATGRRGRPHAPCRAMGKLCLLQHEHVGHAGLGQMVGDRRAPSTPPPTMTMRAWSVLMAQVSTGTRMGWRDAGPREG